MKKASIAIIFVILTSFLFSCQTKETQSEQEESSFDWDGLIEDQLDKAAAQYKHLSTLVPEDRMPKTYYQDRGELETSNTGWWTSGFFPGTLIYLYEGTGDKELWDLAMKKLEILEKEQFNTGTHDLGFMLYCSFGNANRLESNEAYKEIMLKGAESLATRFKPEVGLIRSWDHGSWQYPVIIDNMMNLEFLFWASKVSDDERFKELAITHADHTMKNHFRNDNSSYHVIDYDPKSGEIVGRLTAQGLSDDSAWSRGQAWGLYGYTVMFRETMDPKYLEQAQKIADFTLNQPNFPEDMIPYWDFDAEGGKETLRDASAGAINASALLELAKYVDQAEADKYLAAAEIMIQSLSSEKYRAKNEELGGFLLKHSVGHLKANSEVDVPLTYADYYFVEALLRYKNWYL
ncbi:glycoside hydrolase family 88 protein [Pararhodonellum marinum]|uniref:glycoside hydrolase family 88 protein n=1 Tax=Pararhodonellum marinum TaxID=2755358 RepID=UPI00188F73C1|nr:glycoside hydrolase family 88 protein [Pararhodonellum marinum]